MQRALRSLSRPFIGLALVACTPTPGTSDSDSDSAAGPQTQATEDSDGTSTGGDDDTTSESGTSTETDTGTAPEDLLLSDQFVNIAHRGGALLRPEETLAAFENALDVGADVLEFDLHASSDGVIVAIHDDTVDDTTNGTGAVKEMTFAELRELDAGYRFTTDGGETYPYRGAGLVIPTLDELLEAFPDRHYLIEIKQSEPSIVDDVVERLAAHGIGQRVVIASFSTETIIAVREADPELLTALSLDEMLVLNDSIGDPEYVAPARFVQSPWELTTAELVDFCHELGLKVHPWTVNSGPGMQNMIDRGVDGVMTDDPALLDGLAP